MADTIDWEKGSMTPPAGPDWEQGAMTPPPVKAGVGRKIADKVVGFGVGAVGATKALTDVAGAGNPASGALEGAQQGLQGLLSPEAQHAKTVQQLTLESHKDDGIGGQVAAGARAFMEAPVQTAVEGAGSLVPLAAASLLPGGVVPAVAAGVGMGAGAVKGSIYDDVKRRALAAGKSPEQAEEDAQQAQAYGGGNTDQIALGGALGALDPLVGAGKAAVGMVRAGVGRAANPGQPGGIVRRVATGAATEGAQEAVQGGQEQLATNVAAQRAGYQAGTWEGVGGQAAMEGLAGAAVGGGFGAFNRQPQPPAQAPVAPAAAPTPGGAMVPGAGGPQAPGGGAGGPEVVDVTPIPNRDPRGGVVFDLPPGLPPPPTPGLPGPITSAVLAGGPSVASGLQAPRGGEEDRQANRDRMQRGIREVNKPDPRFATMPDEQVEALANDLRGDTAPDGSRNNGADRELGKAAAAELERRNTAREQDAHPPAAPAPRVDPNAGPLSTAASMAQDSGAAPVDGAPVPRGTAAAQQESAAATAAAPSIATSVDAAAHQAAASPTNEKTESKAQILANNRQLGHGKVGGMPVSFENPSGSVREDKYNDPPQWRTEMRGWHYGYFPGTQAADSTKKRRQGLDVFVKEGLPDDWDGPVHVVDQVDPKTGKFDEHKALAGAATMDEARAAYLHHYEPGWKGIGSISEFPNMAAFRAWATSGKKTKPVGDLKEWQPEPEGEGKVLWRVGLTPADTEDVTVRGGTVFIGGHEAADYDSGAPVRVPAGANRLQVKKALQDAGAVSRKVKFFAAKEESSTPAPTVAPAPAPKQNAPAALAGPIPATGPGFDVESGAPDSPRAATNTSERASSPAPQVAPAPSAPTDAGKAEPPGQQGKPAETAPDAETGAPSSLARDKARLLAQFPAGTAPAPSADTLRAQADLNNALADLGDLLGRPFRANIVPEQEAKLVPILTRVLDAAFRLGYHRFKDAAKFALDKIREALGADVADAITLDHLQGAYIAMAGGKPGVSTKKEVIAVEDKAEIEAHAAAVEAPAPGGDTAPTTPEESPDERGNVRGTSPQALDEVAAQEGGAPAGERGAGAGGADGGPAGSGVGGGADAAGVPPARGRGGRAQGVRAPAAGAGGGDGGLGARGAGRARKKAPRNDAGAPGAAGHLTPAAPNIPASNFRITSDLQLGRGGEVGKFNDNLAAIRALKAIEAEGRRATPEEQAILARYVGWGGLKNAFPSPETGEFKDGWKARGEELRELLTPSEYKAARRSTLDAHYTSEVVVSAMWDAARRLGFRGGLVLEPSMGSGNFLGLAPELPARFIGIEYDSVTARIGGLLYPQAAVLHTGFQYAPLADNAFALAIGNPPFGNQSLRFQYKPELQGVSIHNQFFRASLDAVRPGGLQIMVVSRFLMDAQDTSTRAALARKAKLVAAIRLPDTAFKENARTEVVTDIVILQRRTPGEEKDAADIIGWALSTPDLSKMKQEERDRYGELMRGPVAEDIASWLQTATVKDPLGGEPMVVNRYFSLNKEQVLGTMDRSGTMSARENITVHADPGELPQRLAEAVARLPQGISQIDDEVLARTEERFTLLADALRIAVAKEEPGHLSLNADGQLQRVIEREAPDGGDLLTRQTITPDSPWSERLSMDGEGRWYQLEVVVDEKGEPVKVVKGGKPTKRNLYARTTYATEADVPASLRLGHTGYEKLRAAAGLRDRVKRQLVLETEDASPMQMEGHRKKLAADYEAFVAAFGPINRPANLRLVMTMPDGGLVAALESTYQPERTKAQAAKSGLPEQQEEAAPAPILRERVVPKYQPPEAASTAADALAITLAERGRVDMERIAALRGITQEQAAAELQAGEKPLVFKDPETQTWETADAYLSGMVKRKLAAAREAGLTLNVTALEQVQPQAWSAENVTAQLGATWVPPDDYAAFAQHLLGGRSTVTFAPVTNSFTLVVHDAEPQKMEDWSSPGAPAPYLLNRLLNSQSVLVMMETEDGPRVDQEGTALAIQKGKEIVAEFGDWVFKDGDRRQRLVDIFNERFNVRVNRQFNGSHLKLPGKVPDAIIAMRRHQMNAIWRGIASRFLLLDHVVGAGKTFTGIARAMERRRMGLARKPMIMVPNHLVEQWAIDVYRLYPAAKVLAAGQQDFEAKRRRRLFARIATGDWDIVIVPHSSFGFIGIAPETEQRFLEGELAQAMRAVDEAWEQAKEDGQDQGRRKPFGVKEAERLVDKIQARMDKVREGARDRLLTFEQLGVDDLTVDEAHEFKNLYYSSRLTGVRGMGNKTGSRKATDLYNKVRILREGSGAVTFMTGTPISNSAVEMFTVMRYLAADDLKELGLEHFDAWRTQFVEATPAFEPTESGRLKEVTRLGRTWSNMRSLMDLYYSFTDAVSIDDIKKWYAEDNGGAKFPVPEVKGGDRTLVKIVPTQAQEEALADIIAGFDSLPGIQDPYDRNKERLRLMDRARKVSLDIRAVDPRHASKEEGGKLQRVSQEVKRIYDASTPRRGTQLVFLDRSVPRAKGDDKILKEYDELVARRDKALIENDDDAFQAITDSLDKFDPNEIQELRNAQAGGWNAYQQIKDNLVATGVPAGEIRFVQEATNDEQKQALFDAVKGGKVRVLIGSTQRMGAGTNVQDRLVALHHVDVTWKPSDIEQREGRIIRQGNLFATPPTAARPNPLFDPNFTVEILAYATERTIDAKMWDLNATKLRTINGIRKYDGAFTMEFEDEESVSMAEMAALASGNPLLLERVTLESQINTLELQERAHRRKMYGVQDAVDSAERALAQNPRLIEETERRQADAQQRLAGLAEATAGRTSTVEGETFTNRLQAHAAALQAITAQQQGNDRARYAITVDGKRITSKDGLEEAMADAFGDADAFAAELEDGRKTGRRSVVARVATDKANQLARNLKDGAGTAKVGRLYGANLEVDVERKGERLWLSMSLVELGRTIASTATDSIEAAADFTQAAVRAMLERLIDAVRQAADASWVLRNLRDTMARAERDLPSLRERAKEGFPKAAELEEKRRRLNDVIRQLSGSGGPGQPSANLPPGRYLVTRDDGTVEDAPRELSADDIRELLRHGWKIEPAPADGTDAAFSRGDAQMRRGDAAVGHELRVSAIMRAISHLTKDWARRPDIHVIDSMAEAPEAVRRVWERQNSQGGTGAIEGFHYRGQVYLVADAIASIDDARRVLAHEALGHWGLRSVFGDRLNTVLDELAAARPFLIRRKAKQYGLDLSKDAERRMAAEEVLAELAQTRPDLGWVQRAIAAIRRFLRQLGVTVGLSNNDIVANYILPARGWVERGRSADPSSVLSPAAFLRAFHGTPHTVDRFTTAKMGTGEGAQAYGWGLYFADRREVAEHYRKTLAMARGSFAVRVNGRHQRGTPIRYAAEKLAEESDNVTRDDLVAYFERRLSETEADTTKNPGLRQALTRELKTALKTLQEAESVEVEIDRPKGNVYEVEIPDDGWLLWDKPLSEQPESVRAALSKMRVRNIGGQDMLTMDPQGQEIYRALSRSYGSDMEASLTLKEAGVPGIKFLDGASRTKPLRDVKREFLAELPEDADFDEVMDLVGTGTFSPANEAIVKALQADDWLGFDYPAQAISAALSGKLSNWDASPELVRAVANAQDGGTYNYVVFADEDIEITAAFSRKRTSANGWDMPEPNWLDDLVYKLQDKLIDTKRVIESIVATGKQLADEANVYLQEELFHGRAAKRTEDFVHRELQPLLEDMKARGVELDELDEFLHARHAREANELVAQRNPKLPDGGSGMKTADAEAYMKGLDPAKRAALEAAAAKVDAIIAGTRQLYADYGLESQETVDAWAAMFKHYVPLMREDDGAMGIGQGFSIKGREAKGRTGSTRKVVDILANIAMQRERAIVRGEKNRVAQALVGLARDNPNEDFWEVRSQPPTTPVYDERLKKVVNRPDPLFKSRPNVVMAKVFDYRGRVTEQAVVFNEDDPRAVRMAQSLKNLDATQLEGLLGVSARITRYIASINTQYNPIFGIVNLTRDVPAALLNLTSTALNGKQAEISKHVLSALRGVYSDARAVRKGGQPASPWAALWEDFQDQGGQTGYRDLFRTSADRAEAIRDAIDPERWMNTRVGKLFTADGKLRVPAGMAQRYWSGIFNWLSDYNLAMENATRLAAYKVALEQGMPKAQAASLAKNLTTNFNRKGQVGQQAGAVYAFFNAAMQGTARIGQTLFTMEQGDPRTIRLSGAGKAIVTGGMLLGSMQAVLLAAAGFDDEEPPEFVRERNLVIPTGGTDYVTIPLPLGFHVLTNLGRVPTEFALGGFKKPAAHIVRLLGVAADAFNPIGNAGWSMQTITPTALDPFAALAENRDWTGKPIARESFDKTLPGHALVRDTATAPARMLAAAINWVSGGSEFSAGAFSPTPDQIDYLVGQATGGVGRELSKAMQTASAAGTGEDLPPHKVPLLGRFYGDTASQSAEAGRFYANVNRIRAHSHELKGRRETGRSLEVADYLAQHPEARFTMAAALADREVQKMRAAKRELLEKEAPREQVRQMEERIAARMRRFNQLVASTADQ